MSLSPLAIQKNPSYSELRQRVVELTDVANAFTAIKVSPIASNAKPTFTLSATNSTLNLPDLAPIIKDVEELKEAAAECEAEKIVLEEEIIVLEEEIEALNDIVNGECWNAETVYQWDLNPANPCEGSITTSIGLMCYIEPLNNRHRFRIDISKTQEGGSPFSCGRKLAMYIQPVADPNNFSYGGDSSQTVTLGNFSSQEWQIVYTNDNLFVGSKIIGYIYLPINGQPPTFRPLNSSTNIV